MQTMTRRSRIKIQMRENTMAAETAAATNRAPTRLVCDHTRGHRQR